MDNIDPVVFWCGIVPMWAGAVFFLIYGLSRR